MALTLSFSLLATAAFSQLKEGFSKLDKGDFEAAKVIFEAKYTDADEQLAARWGLVQTLAATENPKPDFDKAMSEANLLLAGIRKAKKDSKEKLESKFDLTSMAVTTFKKGFAKPHWAKLKTTTQLRQLDSFIFLYKPYLGVPEKERLDKLSQLRHRAAQTWKEFEDLRYLVDTSQTSNEHWEWLRDTMPKKWAEIDSNMVPLFLASGHRIGQIESLFSDLPQLSLAKHLLAKPFAAAAKPEKLKPLLAFEIQNPRSVFSKYARTAIREIYQKAPPSAAELAELSPAERMKFDDIVSGGVEASSEFDNTDTSAWHGYILRHAPNSVALQNLNKMLDFYLKTRQWVAASQLLKRFAEHFPLEKERLTGLIPLLETPEEGSAPVPAGPNINTSYASEYLPLLSPDGKSLYFCGRFRKDCVGLEDIFVSEWKDGAGWQPAKLVAGISSGTGNEAPISISSDANQLIYFNNGKPYVAARTESGWTSNGPFPINTGDFNWVCGVQMAPNNRFALFDAALVNTEDIDLYVVFKNDDDTWQAPIRLDSVINTPGIDRSPYLHPDMKHLYFSSNGHGGFGNLDVFVSIRLDDTWLHWSTPVNLGKSVNTTGLDWAFFISPDGTTAWFSRSTGPKSQDIYSMTLPKAMQSEKPRFVEVTVLENKTNKPLGGAEIFVWGEKGDKIGSFISDRKRGTVVFPVDKSKRITLSAKQTGYFPESAELDFAKIHLDSIARIRLLLSPDTGGVVLNSDVLFETGKWDINPSAQAKLKILGDFLRSNKYQVELAGHTDKVGSPEANLELSKHRAQVVRDLLVSVGVPPELISQNGYGETQPICKGQTPDCLQKNRRVDIRWSKAPVSPPRK